MAPHKRISTPCNSLHMSFPVHLVRCTARTIKEEATPATAERIPALVDNKTYGLVLVPPRDWALTRATLTPWRPVHVLLRSPHRHTHQVRRICRLRLEHLPVRRIVPGVEHPASAAAFLAHP